MGDVNTGPTGSDVPYTEAHDVGICVTRLSKGP